MPSAIEKLAELIHSGSLEDWGQRNREVFEALFGSPSGRYPAKAKESVTLRAPEFREDAGVPFAAYIARPNPDAGPYGGMSFVLFPLAGKPCLIGMVCGTQGLAPDEAILGRPGHARKMQAICAWLNRRAGAGTLAAWAKQDPTRTDLEIPENVRRAWSEYADVFKRYGKVVYALYKPGADPGETAQAAAAMLDVMFEERGFVPLEAHRRDAEQLQAEWFRSLMPSVTRAELAELLQARRYVILQGPPGTGKTRMARLLLQEDYGGAGMSVQFHPGTTYENFVGGLAPVHGDGALGLRFAPAPGFLLRAAAEAARDPTRSYLLHVDEINRADLAKVLGEAIFLFEPEPERERDIELPYDFGPPFHRTLRLPPNLHVLGTMNTADRSIAIVDVALRRRFAFVTLWPSAEVVGERSCDPGPRAFRELLSLFIEHASEDGLTLAPGHSYFLAPTPEAVRRKLRTALAPLLEEYLAQGYVAGFAEAVRGYLQWLRTL
jgi:5-methylcytosine-specific restriction protein B